MDAREHESPTPAYPLRAALRADDPGPPREAAQSVVSTSIPQHPAATTGFAFVDLAPAINRDLGRAGIIHGDDIGLLSTLPTGRQRFLGIDYDIRGGIALAMPAAGNDRPPATRPVPVPTPRFAAVHLLLGACCMLQDTSGLLHSPYGFMDVAYADGGHARMPIVYGRDVVEAWADTGDSLAARIAWVEPGPRARIFQNSRYRIYAARFDNPHPQRDVASLSFAATEHAWSGPVILAATLETRDAKSGIAKP